MNRTRALLLLLAASCAAPEEPEPLPVASAEQALLACSAECPAGACGVAENECGGLVWCGDCGCPDGAFTCDLELPGIFFRSIDVFTFQQLDIATSGLSPGADSVIHVIDAFSGLEFGFSDDTGGFPSSRLTFTAQFNTTVHLVVRAKSAATQGTATLIINNTSEPIPLVAAREIRVPNARATETYSTVRVPQDGDARHAIFLMNGEHVRKSVVGNDAGADLTFTTPESQARLLIARRNAGAPPSPARVVRNDAALSGHDPDHDGLGFELERALGTCSTLTEQPIGPDGIGWECSLSADARDTDGDGLTDGWEVFGKRDATVRLPLVVWGARPRHKDVFLEVDWAQSTPGEPAQRLSTDQALATAAIAGDRARALTLFESLLHAAFLRNPDARPGVSVHIDTGVNPVDPSNATHFGNWGGHSTIAPVPDPETGGTRPIDFGTAFNGPNIAPIRRGVFRYAITTATGSGKGPAGGGPSFWVALSNGLQTTAHEMGHTFGIAHSGRGWPAGTPGVKDVNCKPNYASIMNYAFTFGAGGFSDGMMGASLNNARLVEAGVAKGDARLGFRTNLRNSFGYFVDDETGDVDWNRDGAIASEDDPVRAYANYNPGGSCEYTRDGFEILGKSDALMGPAFARVKGGLTVLIPSENALEWRSKPGPDDCPVPGWCDDDWRSGSIGVDSVLGVDAAAVRDDTSLVVTRGGGHQLRFFLMRTIFGVPQFSGLTDLPGGIAVAEPSLASDVDGSVLLMFVDASLRLKQASFTLGAGFGPIDDVLDGDGAPITVDADQAPGLLVAPLRTPDNPGGEPRMLMAVSQGPRGGRITVFERSPKTGRFVRTQLPVQNDMAKGRIALAWRPDKDDQHFGGRLYLVYNSAGQLREFRAMRQMWTYVKVGARGEATPQIGLASSLDNQWTYARGLDLTFEPGDKHLQLAFTRSEGWPGQHGDVQLFPKADGLLDYEYADWNDWLVIRTGVCEHLVNSSSSPAVVCPDRDW